MRSEAKKYVGVKKEYDALVRKREKNPRPEMLESLAGGLSIQNYPMTTVTSTVSPGAAMGRVQMLLIHKKCKRL